MCAPLFWEFLVSAPIIKPHVHYYYGDSTVPTYVDMVCYYGDTRCYKGYLLFVENNQMNLDIQFFKV